MKNLINTKQQQKLSEFWLDIKNQLDASNEDYCALRPYRTLRLKKARRVDMLRFNFITQVVVIRSSLINDRELLLILKEHPSYLGLTPNFSFGSGRTSAYAFKYESIAIVV